MALLVLVVVRRGQTPTLLKVPQNPIAGIDPTVDYSLGETRLERGDLLLLYTDGVTEALNAQGALFGETRMLATLSGLGGGAAAAIETLRDATRLFCGNQPQSDDVTLLALRFVGPA